MEFTATVHAVHIADRLPPLAKQGEFLAGAQTVTFVSNHPNALLSPRGEHQLKDRSVPVLVHEVRINPTTDT